MPRRSDCQILHCTQAHCAVCGYRHLRDDEPQTCLPCLGATRRALADLHELTTLAATVMDGYRTATGLTDVPVRSSEPGTPGGDLLVLLAPGSNGRSEDGTTWRADDPNPLLWLLASWKEDWRTHLKLTGRRQRRANQTVSESVRFFETHLSWAADHHPAFADFTDEIHASRARLEDLLHAGDRPLRGAVPCLDCGGGIARDYYDPKPCAHAPEPCGCDQGGLRTLWLCRRCQRTYTDAEYWLTVREHKQARRPDPPEQNQAS